MQNFPLRHLSVRVAWHDNGWNGKVCQAPHLNHSCVKLANIAEKKNEQLEISLIGQRFCDLPIQQRPSCFEERAMFMADFPFTYQKNHALANINGYKHFLPTTHYLPAY